MTWKSPSAKRYVEEMNELVPMAVRVVFSDGEAEVVVSDLERFQVLRDKLTDPTDRYPIGHPKSGDD